ncbi:primosomal protein N' [Rubrobacter xylanophilus DSM 9941]|uniref:Primosomal protein N n=1 Tax=Rubrobacter xylanophilus (strain DSM 9941 / JCM 11954 / NBRC 16129 / PRD-1) TaxID=266117 RepID=Q1AVZ7_RUBXD|nr:primosomal protein N' [Rubrobacter xylanophilus]ABG04431.1 primosomal protein N' [Rubrobacter xylanophilus DSM 9941]
MRLPRAARVALLVNTHALPPLSYLVPERLRRGVGVGFLVVVRLSGRGCLGVVVGLLEGDGRAREEILRVLEGLRLPPAAVELCLRVCEEAAAPLAPVLRAALPPGLGIAGYRVRGPLPGWPWRRGELVSRAAARRVLGAALREAEGSGRLELVPSLPEPRTVEVAALSPGPPPDLRRAPRQRALLEALRARGGRCRTDELLREAPASRQSLRALAARGALRLLRVPEPPPLLEGLGPDPPDAAAAGAARGALQGGLWLWRSPSRTHPAAAAALAAAAVSSGRQALVLLPEVEGLEPVVEAVRRVLPRGASVAPYHAGMGRSRSAVYRAAAAGSLDVLVGTRAAALIPLGRPRPLLCVVDEPNEAHRAGPGYEGVPLHVRELVRLRAAAEEGGALFLASCPSLSLYGRPGLRELPPRPPERWPAVRIVDMRGSGAPLSRVALEACRSALRAGRRVGVVGNRLGYAAAVVCNGCGAPLRCPRCDLALADGLSCPRCGGRQPPRDRCPGCGSARLSPSGLAVERLRQELSRSLGAEPGLLAGGRSVRAEEAPVVVGTPRPLLSREWDRVVVPDADHLLLGAAARARERAFRLLHRAAESARSMLIIQTRHPDDPTLRAAVEDDYPSFARAELGRLRALGYPPFGGLVAITLHGREEEVRRAVESLVRPALRPGVELRGPVPAPPAGGPSAWRVLLRSREPAAAARAGRRAALRLSRESGLRVRVEVDPEEV